MTVEHQFVERMRTLLVSLPYDLKVLFEAMTDEDLPLEARKLATAAAIYCLSPTDAIPDNIGIVGFTDDTIVVRLVLKQMLQRGGDAVADYPERFPEQFDNLDEDLALVRSYLGQSMDWLERRMQLENLEELRYKGKTVSGYLADDESAQRLYEDGLGFTTDYEIDDEAVQRLTSGKPVLEAFDKRRQIEESRRGG
jgi:uncharacterized membrane protein YkvA (DUF1232 family)